MPAKKQYQDIKVGLNEADRVNLSTMARAEGRTKTEFARDAIRFYLANYDEIKGQSKEAQTAQAIRYATDQIVKAINLGVDRICKMLARQGRAVGTLYELAYMALPDDDRARDAFNEAVRQAKQKMARHVENDEREMAERMKTVVKG